MSVVVTVGVAGEGQMMAMSFGGCWIMHVDYRREGMGGGEGRGGEGEMGGEGRRGGKI